MSDDSTDVEVSKEVEKRSPTEINVVKFVRNRVGQICELMQVIDAGEVTKGPRTAVQHLPRHMRRRAMSHQIKRFPRCQRRFAKDAVASSKHRKKPASRYSRRRPRNLLLNYIRRQKKSIWLETHIWHAKRYKIVDKWGYKLPLDCYQRSFRSTYRDSLNHCSCQDMSYLHCFQIYCSDQLRLTDLLKDICAAPTGATFGFKAAFKGAYEISTYLYFPGRYPHGLVGPVRFMWSFDESTQNHILIVWLHPTCSKQVLNILIGILNLNKLSDVGGDVDITRTPSDIKEWRLHNMIMKTDTYIGLEGIKLYDLSDQLVRFRLQGSSSLLILNNVIRTVDEDCCHEPWMKKYIRNNRHWNSCLKNYTIGELRDGSIVTLLVEDPKLTRPLKKMKPKHCYEEKQLMAHFVLPDPQNKFWDRELRREVLNVKVTEAELQSIRANNLALIQKSEAKVPIVLVIQNGGMSRSMNNVGIDLVVPSGFGMEFWIALQYGTARSVGLNGRKALEFEAGRFHFPDDIPDWHRAAIGEQDEMNELQRKYFSHPCNRRIVYWDRLSVLHPFRFAWNELAHQWSQQTSGTAFVIRDRALLLSIEKWINGNSHEHNVEISKRLSMALVPVQLEALATGVPKRFSLICAPVEGDFSAISNGVLEEPVRGRELETVETPSVDDESSNERSFENVIDICGEGKGETIISLGSLFHDKEEERLKKRLSQRSAKRQKLSKSKETSKGIQNSNSNDLQLAAACSNQSVRYRESCSRLIIGRVVRGDFSFSSGMGRATGYICYPALELIRSRRVLFRNVSSKYYHPALFSIAKTQTSL